MNEETEQIQDISQLTDKEIKQIYNKLDVPELNFVTFIAQGINQTVSAQKAYPLVKSANYAHVKAQRLLHKDTIKLAIRLKEQEIKAKNDATHEELNAAFKRLAQKAEDKALMNEARMNYAELAKHVNYYEADNKSKAGDKAVNIIAVIQARRAKRKAVASKDLTPRDE